METTRAGAAKEDDGLPSQLRRVMYTSTNSAIKSSEWVAFPRFRLNGGVWFQVR